MRKLWILLLATPLLVGSTCMPDARFVKAMDSGTAILVPEYLRYVQDDPQLDAPSKRARQVLCEELRKTIQEAQK